MYRPILSLFCVIAFLLAFHHVHASGGYVEQVRKEVVQKLSRFCEKNHNNDLKKCFKDNAGPDGMMDLQELNNVLSRAEVGNIFTRSIIAAKILEFLDKDGNKKICEKEFNSALATDTRLN